MTPFGILNVNKPAGMSSRRAVDQIARLAPRSRVGHAGTLDPLATGVLVICVGQATRLIQYVQRMPKRYHATFRLGVRSETDDVEGDVVPVERALEPSRGAVDSLLQNFIGVIEQRPPAHSAIKLAGKRAYQLARRGVEVALEPRPVMIHELAVRRYEYPILELDIQCGSGTYVRALGRDIGQALRTGAVMTALERIAIGGFHVQNAVGPRELTSETLPLRVQPALAAVADLPQLVLSAAQLVEIRNGRPVLAEWLSDENRLKVASPTPLASRCGTIIDATFPYQSAGSEFAALDPTGQLVAILFEKQPGELWPRMNLSDSSER